MACLVTGITPQQALAEGVSERDFIGHIIAELGQPGTCGVGYNSLRFDDEVTRYTLYRNFHDPYEREWRNGNSRWDIIDMVRATHALRPDGIDWPLREDGLPSFRLEDLTAANGISHEAAHDALSDVHATIAMARLVRERQPKLYDYVLGLRHKRAVLAQLDIEGMKPLLHVSGMFGAAQFRAMRRDARFINVGRGGLVDEPALVKALRGAEIAGAALDVFATEPLSRESPLWTMDNVIVSPHMSGDFVGYHDALAALFCANLARYLDGEPLANVVDKRLGFVPP